jgi:hypothetical protein
MTPSKEREPFYATSRMPSGGREGHTLTRAAGVDADQVTLTVEEEMTFLRRLFRTNKPQIFGGWQY